MGIFGRKTFKVAFLGGDKLFRYQIDRKNWNTSGLDNLLADPANLGKHSSDGHEFVVYLINERETAGRHVVNIVGPNGQIASIDDSGLWIIIVKSVQKMRLSGVQTDCRLIVDLIEQSGKPGVQSMHLDLPPNFPSDLKSSPNFRIIEIQE